MDNSESSEHQSQDWKKTKLLVFASCVNPDDQAIKEKEESCIQKREPENDSFEIKTNNEDLEEDDVFIWNLPRRASEPVLLKRTGNASLFRLGRQKPSKLRSLSEGVPVPVDRRHALTRSASSSDTQTAFSRLLTFSPQVVKKINLSASLQDWLESEKQLRDEARKTVARNIANNMERLASNDNCFAQNCDVSMRKETYRRRSADAVVKKTDIDDGQRPSAPPALSGKENKKLRQNNGGAYIVSCYNSDIKFDSIHEFQIHSLIKEELQSRLGGVCFCPQSCRKWCEEISQVIKNRIQVLVNTSCKVVCTIYIGAIREHGIHTASQATLDYKLDYHVSACYQNESLFAAVSVLVARYGCR